MKKESFYDILCHSTPEEMNEYISSKGKRKEVNAITFIKPDMEIKNNSNNDETNNIKGE